MYEYTRKRSSNRRMADSKRRVNAFRVSSVRQSGSIPTMERIMPRSPSFVSNTVLLMNRDKAISEAQAPARRSGLLGDLNITEASFLVKQSVGQDRRFSS